MKTTDRKLSRCPMCDAMYDHENAGELEIHQHPEPQSGSPREAWRESNLDYNEWIRFTPEGRAWRAGKVEKSPAYPVEDNLLTRQLMTFLTPAQAVSVLVTFSNICEHCHDSYKPCSCSRDE